ncbi:MAG TPA: DNA-binding transcriptional regulator Fis [Psychromonas hadalis]|jgi:Fis family transcriptional regulator|nr:DNA-binding transcriptional regulator Fis [Psychromonas hadalis]
MFEQNIPQEALTTTTSIPATGQITQRPLRDSVRQAVSGYVSKLNGKDTTDLYELVLCEVEAPMLDVIMQYTRGNQTRAANMMGINRGTLRKKLKKYGLD